MNWVPGGLYKVFRFILLSHLESQNFKIATSVYKIYWSAGKEYCVIALLRKINLQEPHVIYTVTQLLVKPFGMM